MRRRAIRFVRMGYRTARINVNGKNDSIFDQILQAVVYPTVIIAYYVYGQVFGGVLLARLLRAAIELIDEVVDGLLVVTPDEFLHLLSVSRA